MRPFKAVAVSHGAVRACTCKRLEDAVANDDNTTVSFRLTPALHDELLKQAEAARTTKHQLARTLVVRALSSGEQASPTADLSGIDPGKS